MITLHLFFLLLLLPLLTHSFLDTEVINGQSSPSMSCDVMSRGTGNCPTLTTLSPYLNIGSVRYSQYHTSPPPELFQNVPLLEISPPNESDPWGVGRFTLSHRPVVRMPNTFSFGSARGVELRTVRVVVGERTNEWSPDTDLSQHQIEVSVTGRNLDQQSETHPDSFISFSMLYLIASPDDAIVDYNDDIKNLIDVSRATPSFLNLTQMFPSDFIDGISTYEGSSGSVCDCARGADTTWLFLNMFPVPYLSRNVLYMYSRGSGYDESAWRTESEDESRDIEVVYHTFRENCDEKFGDFCEGGCECGSGVNTVQDVEEDMAEEDMVEDIKDTADMSDMDTADKIDEEDSTVVSEDPQIDDDNSNVVAEENGGEPDDLEDENLIVDNENEEKMNDGNVEYVINNRTNVDNSAVTKPVHAVLFLCVIYFSVSLH